MSLIRTKNLGKIYKPDGIETVGLAGVNLEINEGEFVAIMGPSGSGKSTLLQLLGCLDRPTSGEYFFEEKELSKYSDNELAYVRNKKMGFVFQSFNLLPRISVLENVKLPLVYAETSEPRRTEVAAKMIARVGLEDRQHYLATNLSGGQKQRVAIARALVGFPKVIFADEPTGNLDSKSGEVILKFFEELNREGKTIILVTHETYVAESAQRIIHLKDGLIEKDEKVKNRHQIFKDGFIK